MGVADLIRTLVTVAAFGVVDARIFGIKFVRRVLLVGAIGSSYSSNLCLPSAIAPNSSGRTNSCWSDLRSVASRTLDLCQFFGLLGCGGSRSRFVPDEGWTEPWLGLRCACAHISAFSSERRSPCSRTMVLHLRFTCNKARALDFGATRSQ